MSTDKKQEKIRKLQLNITVEGDNRQDITDKLRDIADSIDKDIEDKDIPTKREH